ncbi:hypothetical protein [Sphingopyxis sp. KK2]|uniref:hypothetical protein n=1 Tax=Sphingopyxis sp. KK2 TaxID=1855727 RepID=UPI00097E60E8|nr:hypothetical protein [Sphingopyxis sp. KK2]
MIDDKQGQGADGKQKGPGEQIREREDEENRNLNNLRGGADPSGGQSSEVPRNNGAGSPGADGGGDEGERDILPLSTPSEGRADERPTEDDLVRHGGKPTAGDK